MNEPKRSIGKMVCLWGGGLFLTMMLITHCMRWCGCIDNKLPGDEKRVEIMEEKLEALIYCENWFGEMVSREPTWELQFSNSVGLDNVVYLENGEYQVDAYFDIWDSKLKKKIRPYYTIKLKKVNGEWEQLEYEFKIKNSRGEWESFKF